MTSRSSRWLLTALLLLVAAPSRAQLLIQENFDYSASTLLTANGYSAHSSPGSNPILVTANNLTLAGYPSGTGNAASMVNSGEDVNRTFASQTSGTVYVSMLVRVAAAASGGDYFFNLGGNPIGTTFNARVFVQSTTGGVRFGIGKGGAPSSYGSTVYPTSSTVLLVLSYEFVSGASNDVVRLYTFAAGGDFSSEPGTPVSTTATGTDLSTVASYALRQSSATYQTVVDGIRIGTAWGPTVVGETASVAFQTPGTGSVLEGGSGTATVVYTLANSDGTPGNNPAVSGTLALAAGGTATGPDFDTIGTFTFAAGTANGLTADVSIPTIDDALVEGTETGTFGFSGLAGGTGSGTFILTLNDNDATVSQTLASGRAYRLLSAPVTGVTVGTLAGVNLVQGVTGQYPGGSNPVAPNLFLSYPGTGGYNGSGYVAAPSVTTPITPGEGFFWQLYDIAFTPPNDPATNGGGTSQSYVLATRPLTATGTAITGNTSVVFAENVTDHFYMGGNPFATAMTADGITATTGTLNNFIQLYGPATPGAPATFITRPRDATTTVSTWQGFFLEQVNTGTGLTVFYDGTKRVAGNGTIVGRPAAVRGLAFALAGVTAEGVATLDEAAQIHVAGAATAGWDAGDASKLVPPSATYALLAPVGERGGQAYRQAVLSLPTGADVPLAFTATHAGTYTLTAEATDLPADATLRDLTTGQAVRLADGYTFTSAATDWTERFVVSLGRGATAGEDAPAARTLTTPAPNPATGTARLALRLPAAERVTATVVDALGRTVATVFDGEAPAGTELALDVDASRLAPGVYVVRVQGATFSETRRLTVVR